MNSSINLNIEGYVKISNPLTGKILLDKHNSIHYENFSVAIAESLSAGPLEPNCPGFIYTMNFGNGGTTVNESGIVTYNPPNIIGTAAQLYNQTYTKVINNQFAADVDSINNNITINHITGNAYSDIIVSCRLDYGEPSDQLYFDNANDIESNYAFDELGLFGFDGKLLTHVIFSPILKSLNRLIDISYTVRISTINTIISAPVTT
jgi:hypothetical protein